MGVLVTNEVSASYTQNKPDVAGTCDAGPLRVICAYTTPKLTILDARGP